MEVTTIQLIFKILKNTHLDLWQVTPGSPPGKRRCRPSAAWAHRGCGFAALVAIPGELLRDCITSTNLLSD
jgi:hypothetical protein